MTAMLRGIGLSLAAGLVAVACSTFSGEGADPGSDGGPESGTPADGGSADGTMALDAAGDADTDCVARAPTCSPSGCAVEDLRPAAPQLKPFSLVTDATHLYWVEQVQEDGGPDAYNGGAKARIMRMPKAGGTAEELIRDQDRAVAIEVADDHVYWASGGNPAKVLRVKRTCTSPCTPEPVMVPGGTIVSIRRARDGSLFTRTDNDVIRSIDTSGTFAMLRSSSLSPADALAALPSGVVSMHRLDAGVTIVSNDGQKETTYASVPPNGGFAAGLEYAAGSCDRVWTARIAPGGFALHTIEADAAVAQFGPIHALGIYDFKVDQAYVYIAMPNAGGLYALSTTNSLAAPILVGGVANVFALAVDDDAVYWGVHDTGVIRRMKKR